jgi:hypothetical protein
MADVEEFCTCPDWEPCGCGNQEDGPHCVYCAHPLSPGQLAAFDFDMDEHIPPRPRGLPTQIQCGACETTIDNPTQEQVDFHLSDEHIGMNQIRRPAQFTPKEEN